MAKHPRPFALDHLDFPRFTEVPQPPRDFPATQKLEIGRIEYEAPNFISNGATQYNLAEALKRELEGFSFRDEVKYPDMLAPEMEINVPFMTVKSQATDEAGLARDTVAEIKRELIKSANLFAKLHLMNYEKTGEWPEWYNKRWDPLYEEAILWQAPMFRGFEPPTGPIAELNMVDKAALMLAQFAAMESDMDNLGAMQQAKGWSDEDMDRMLPEFELRKWKAAQAQEENAAQENQESQDLGLLDKVAEVAKEGLEQVLDVIGPEEAEAKPIEREEEASNSIKMYNGTNTPREVDPQETKTEEDFWVDYNLDELTEDLLEKNAPVMILAENDNGIISDASGSAPIKNQGPTAEERTKIMESIESLKGTPYPPDEGGLECSHAVHEAYKNAGLDYEYLTSRAFPGKYFIEISEDELQPGDIVHWPGHVSIYKEGTGQDMIVIGARRPGKLLSETPARYFDDHGSRTYYRLVR